MSQPQCMWWLPGRCCGSRPRDKACPGEKGEEPVGAEGEGKVLRPDKASANLAGGEGEGEAPMSMYDLDVTYSPSTIQLPLVITPWDSRNSAMLGLRVTGMGFC